MPYLIHPRGDGLEPGWSLVPGDHEPVAGEVLADERPAGGLVWDSAAGGLRHRTAAERLAEAKAAKLAEIAARGVDELAPLFTPGVGRDETALLVASHVLKLCEALKVPPDPRLKAIVGTGQKALQKKTEVEAAGSVEEAEAVEWT